MLIGLCILGLFVGFSSGFFGIGGGTLLVPILVLFGFDVKIAIGISVMQMIFSSIFGSYVNFKAGMLELHNGVFLGIGALFGAALSGYIVSSLSPLSVLILFATILALSIYKFFTAPIVATKTPNESKPLLIAIGVIIGAIAISTGTGGAVFLTPFLVGFLHWDIRKAVSTTLFFIIFGSISGFISLCVGGLVDYRAGVAVGIGSLVGVFFGVKLAHKTSKIVQKRALLTLYVVMLSLTVIKIVDMWVK